MKILFSPVGGTDPISQQNMRDGSLLHICRVYKPDRVYLYMSHEMLELQKQDDRYRYCLKKLCELQGRDEMDILEIERDELIDVQDYDYFYNDFRNILVGILDELEPPDDELLLNISSGTPAMKSGLLILAKVLEYPCLTIQVATPEKSMNEHSVKDYDVKTLWELNPDNAPDFENRCVLIRGESLTRIKQEQLIIKLIDEYDYSAAGLIAEELPEIVTDPYLKYIKIAEKRLQLNQREISAFVKQSGMPGFPVRDEKYRDVFEYALYLDVKIKKGEYADFIRAVSPVVLELFKRMIRESCGIDIDDYTGIDDRRAMKWDSVKLEGSSVGQILMQEFKSFNNKGPVYSSHLIEIIRNTYLKDDKGAELAEKIRDVEDNARNIAVHQITWMSDERIKKLTGFSSAEISSLIHCCFKYAGIRIEEEWWNAYETMNEFIISKVGSHRQ